jgi:diguanylate cyclase (GGDEF)-like protein
VSNLKVETNVLDEWQHISNLVADFCNVPVALIMRKHVDAIQVVVGSEHALSPFKRNETAPLNGDLCCEWVINTQQPLHIPNALHDPQWDHNPDIDLGMIFYYGVPINLPDGAPFGTLCILHCEEKVASEKEMKLVKRFARGIELMLELMQNKEALYQQSITDDLTGIPNRRHFFDCLNKEFQRAQRHHTTFCVAMIDLDHFKEVNDQFGHDEGDGVLALFTRQFKSIIRAEDTLGRVGGEEFALIMPMTALAEARLLLDRFRCMVEETLFFDVRRVTFSAGIVECSVKHETADVLLSQADKELYRAKQQGRNQICC